MIKCGGTDGKPGQHSGTHPKHNLLLMYTTCKGCPDCKPSCEWCFCGKLEDDHKAMRSTEQVYIPGVGWCYKTYTICPSSLFRRQI